MSSASRVENVAAPEGVDREHALLLMREMLRIRRFEEKAAEVYTLSRILGFLHLYIGEEAVAVGAMQALTQEDRIVATYREHGQALARGIPAKALMAEMYGKVTGCSRGHGGSMHFFDLGRRFYGGYGIVGGGLPIAVGLALADRMQQHADIVTACFFGDGAVAEGEFFESLNLSALWKLPVLFLCENNLYAMGTALERHQAQTSIALKAQGQGVASATVDGMDVVAVEAACRQAADIVRKTGNPFLLELRTYRFRAHSMADPDLYRNKKEINEWQTRDPIMLYQTRLRGQELLSDKDLSEMEAAIAAELAEAIDFAETSPWEPVENLLKDVSAPEAGKP